MASAHGLHVIVSSTVTGSYSKTPIFLNDKIERIEAPRHERREEETFSGLSEHGDHHFWRRGHDDHHGLH